MKRILFLILELFSFSAFSFPNSISAGLLEKLKASGELQNVFLAKNEAKLSLVPKTELSELAVKKWTFEEKPRLTTEKLFYLDKNSLGADAEAKSKTELTVEKVSKILRSISTMKGSEYYSNRHKKWEVLYHDACLLDSKENKNPIPDDTEGSADGKILYCMQDDNSFGKCYYQLEYRQTEKEVSVYFDNFEPLKFGPITAAKAHNVKINLVAVDEGDYYLVYLLVQASYPRISLFENMMLDSFNSRVDSIYKWFVREANK